MLRYILTIIAAVSVAVIGFVGFQGKKSKETPLWGPKLFNNMDYQSKYRALGESEFEGFADGAAARPRVAGTVARGTGLQEAKVFSADYTAALQLNPEFATGKNAAGKFIDGFPAKSVKPAADGKSLADFKLDAAFVQLGQQKFETYCAVCHGVAANGQGIMKRRGETTLTVVNADGTTGVGKPDADNAWGSIRNLHDADIRTQPNGQIFETISHGAKTMLGYGDKLSPEERWAVIAYLRALQLSQRCPDELVPASVDKTNLK